MKFGFRTPSPKRSLKAMTTGRAKRAVRRAIDPTYGKKGAGWVKNPKKAAYNKIYNKTSIGARDVLKGSKKKKIKSGNDDDLLIFKGWLYIIVIGVMLGIFVSCSVFH